MVSAIFFAVLPLVFSAPSEISTTAAKPVSMIEVMNQHVDTWPSMSNGQKFGLLSADRALTYFEAHDLCKAHGADGLAEIFDQEQQEFINHNLENADRVLEYRQINTNEWEKLENGLVSNVDAFPCSYSLAWLGAQRFGKSYWEWNAHGQAWEGYRNWLNDAQEFKPSKRTGQVQAGVDRMCLQMVISNGKNQGKWRSERCTYSVCPVNPMGEFVGSKLALCQKKM